mmetsp:Transcript_3874/g.8566  ORF Transcript_3874/g.8566 Transcript_3874/m.8566 type:complete len:104 (-) Transcript_3874:195-506(-)
MLQAPSPTQMMGQSLESDLPLPLHQSVTEEWRGGALGMCWLRSTSRLTSWNQLGNQLWSLPKGTDSSAPSFRGTDQPEGDPDLSLVADRRVGVCPNSLNYITT